jgi:hypothetical protein
VIEEEGRETWRRSSARSRLGRRILNLCAGSAKRSGRPGNHTPVPCAALLPRAFHSTDVTNPPLTF